MAGFLVGLLATFLFVRINTRLIRAQVSWWFHDIESEGGTHVHHMVIGVVLMVTVGVCSSPWRPDDLLAQVLALLFGVGVALTLDEFALILNLQDVYWRKEGRLSVDAVIIVVCVAGAVRAGRSTPSRDLEQPGDERRPVPRASSRWYVAVVIVPVLICLLKGKIWTGVLGTVHPARGDRRRDPAGAAQLAVGAPALREEARRSSPGCKRREARLDARWIAWRDAFFDLIAGKPHLPSLPPLGPSGRRPRSADAGADCGERGSWRTSRAADGRRPGRCAPA